jgi:hypothetical protein
MKKANKSTEVKSEKIYLLESRESADVIEIFFTYEDAQKRLIEFENSDKKENIFVENFYHIKTI